MRDEANEELSEELRKLLNEEAQAQNQNLTESRDSYESMRATLGQERGLISWLRSRRTSTRVTIMTVPIVATVLAVLRFSVRPDLAEASTRLSVATLIYGCALLGVLSVVFRPLHLPGWPTSLARFFLSLGLGGTLGLALVPLATGQPLVGPDLPFAAGAMGCFIWGQSLSLPVLTLGLLLERGGSDLTGRLLGVGGAAGLAGNLYLECHCPIARADHLVMGHVSVLLVTLSIGVLLAVLAKRKR
jgi:hypothetical protein